MPPEHLSFRSQSPASSGPERTSPEGDETLPELQFTDLLASTIHDMKNALGVVLNGLEAFNTGDLSAADRRHWAQLQFEVKRFHHKLIQLLAFYKMGHAGGIPAHVDEYAVADLLEECLAQEQGIIECAGLRAAVEVDETLTWTFDRELVTGVLGSAIHNAVRHAAARLLLRASVRDGLLELAVCDDGPGYPREFLELGGGGGLGDRDAGARGHGVDFRRGNTGLGLTFAALIAGHHRCGGRRGRIELANGEPLGGARFTLLLP